jgi:hypothetical protein
MGLLGILVALGLLIWLKKSGSITDQEFARLRAKLVA